MVLTVSFALSLVSRAFLPPSQRDAKHHRQLMPASGHQDHTISPSTKRVARLATPLRPSHPAPTFVTIAKRPSWWVRDGENDASDLGNRTTMHSCDTLARRANHPARVKPCQVTSNCFAEVASANAGAHTPRFVLWPKICDGFLALSHPLVVMGPCVRRDDRGEVRVVRDVLRSIRGTRPLLASARSFRGSQSERQESIAPRCCLEKWIL
jgi:hypothetical protein